MFDRLAQMDARYEDLGTQLSDPTLVSDQKKFQATAKQHRDLEAPVEKYRQYRSVQQAVADAKAMLADPGIQADPEMRAMATDELATLEPRLEAIEAELRVMLLPKDPNDDKNIVIEVRAGTGGDEASLFVA